MDRSILPAGFRAPKAISEDYAHTKSLIPTQSPSIDFGLIECVDCDENRYRLVVKPSLLFAGIVPFSVIPHLSENITSISVPAPQKKSFKDEVTVLTSIQILE
jgi:hypothetical protein